MVARWPPFLGEDFTKRTVEGKLSKFTLVRYQLYKMILHVNILIIYMFICVYSITLSIYVSRPKSISFFWLVCVYVCCTFFDAFRASGDLTA